MTSKETLKSLKKIQTKIKKGLPKKIKLEKLNTKLANRLNEQAQEAVQKATRTAQVATQVATEAAKSSLDQVLLGLEHRGLNIKESQDLALKVGRKVLERAEAIRAQIAENPLTPSWLKEVRLKCADQDMAAETATETTAVSTEIPSTTSAPAAGMAEPVHGDRASANLAAEAFSEFDESESIEKPVRKTKRATTGARKAGAAAPRATK